MAMSGTRKEGLATHRTGQESGRGLVLYLERGLDAYAAHITHFLQGVCTASFGYPPYPERRLASCCVVGKLGNRTLVGDQPLGNGLDICRTEPMSRVFWQTSLVGCSGQEHLRA